MWMDGGVKEAVEMLADKVVCVHCMVRRRLGMGDGGGRGRGRSGGDRGRGMSGGGRSRGGRGRERWGGGGGGRWYIGGREGGQELKEYNREMEGNACINVEKEM